MYENYDITESRNAKIDLGKRVGVIEQLLNYANKIINKNNLFILLYRIGFELPSWLYTIMVLSVSIFDITVISLKVTSLVYLMWS